MLVEAHGALEGTAVGVGVVVAVKAQRARQLLLPLSLLRAGEAVIGAAIGVVDEEEEEEVNEEEAEAEAAPEEVPACLSMRARMTACRALLAPSVVSKLAAAR